MVHLDSEFMNYLAEHACEPGTQLPALSALSQELGLSISKLREQLEVARSMGFVDVRPRLGIQTRAYAFAPGIRTSMRYALAVDPEIFHQIEDMREHLESGYWETAVSKLEHADIRKLEGLVSKAWSKLRGTQIQIPHDEHRELHLTIFSRLGNPFVQGFLEAYWDAYEIVGLALYTDYRYLEQVWSAHEQMVEAIARGDDDSGHATLVKHFAILQTRPQATTHDNDDGAVVMHGATQTHTTGRSIE